MNQQGDPPREASYSWKTLAEVLRDIGPCTLASEIEEVKKTVIMFHRLLSVCTHPT